MPVFHPALQWDCCHITTGQKETLHLDMAAAVPIGLFGSHLQRQCRTEQTLTARGCSVLPRELGSDPAFSQVPALPLTACLPPRTICCLFAKNPVCECKMFQLSKSFNLDNNYIIVNLQIVSKSKTCRLIPAPTACSAHQELPTEGEPGDPSGASGNCCYADMASSCLC